MRTTPVTSPGTWLIPCKELSIESNAGNQRHGITPKTIQKAVADIMKGTYGSARGSLRKFAKVAEETMQYASMKLDKFSRKIRELEQ